MCLLALRHTGHQGHPRAREAVRLLFDRMLPQGGSNYGNTIVFGQALRPHLEPTGLSVLALAPETDGSERTARSIAYLAGALSAQTATASLSYGLLGLAAVGRWPDAADQWLAAAAQRTITRDPGAYKLALLALAGLGPASPLIPGRRESVLP
jgi:hypothetical protein